MASIQGASNERFHQHLVTAGIIFAQSGALVFTHDHLSTSPSLAAMALMGRSAIGWVEWNHPQGKSAGYSA